MSECSKPTLASSTPTLQARHSAALFREELMPALLEVNHIHTSIGQYRILEDVTLQV